MKKHQKEAILIAFYNEKEKYRKLGEYFTHFIKDDPLLPEGSLHTVIYRIKNELRLIEKIDGLNKEGAKGRPPISEKNFQTMISDILGVRLICLRLSDIEKIESYLQLLAEENIVTFEKGPEKKRSFILPVHLGDSMPDDVLPQHSGYSSIHYQIRLGENSDAPPELKKILFELQLRTILEEAWGEIDHKYRYVRSRIGDTLPEHIHMGFYNLSAYLQVAALQAEHLCRLVEAHNLKKSEDESFPQRSLSEIGKHLKNIFGFEVNPRTLIYIEKRLEEVNSGQKNHITLQELFTQKRLSVFRTVFREILAHEPFMHDKNRNIDVINALNFSIFVEVQGERVAQEGLRAVLRWRKDSSTC